jgi:UDP-N-acetylmuramate dehydrogenase
VHDILQRVKMANQVRLSKQPLDMPSCGSVFVNPPGGKSGQLIELCGLKGFSVGGAQVSPKHANFIVNFDHATASDIHQVIDHVRATVMAKAGVQLHTEVVYLGEW